MHLPLRFDPYSKTGFAICRICKSSVHQSGSHYCQGCAYKKGINSLILTLSLSWNTGEVSVVNGNGALKIQISALTPSFWLTYTTKKTISGQLTLLMFWLVCQLLKHLYKPNWTAYFTSLFTSLLFFSRLFLQESVQCVERRFWTPRTTNRHLCDGVPVREQFYKRIKDMRLRQMVHVCQPLAHIFSILR